MTQNEFIGMLIVSIGVIGAFVTYILKAQAPLTELKISITELNSTIKNFNSKIDDMDNILDIQNKRLEKGNVRFENHELRIAELEKHCEKMMMNHKGGN